MVCIRCFWFVFVLGNRPRPAGVGYRAFRLEVLVIMDKITLTTKKYPQSVPDNTDAGRFFLLRFSGWQWQLARYSDERQQFYYEGGDYVEDGCFEWFMLPDRGESTPLQSWVILSQI